MNDHLDPGKARSCVGPADDEIDRNRSARFTLYKRHGGLSIRIGSEDEYGVSDFPLTRKDALYLASSILSFYEENSLDR